MGGGLRTGNSPSENRRESTDISVSKERVCVLCVCCVCVSFVCAFTENGKPEDMFSKDYYCISQVMRNYVKGETFSQQD